MKLKCLAVDDEPLALEVLATYIGDCPSLELSGLCRDALEAGEFLNDHEADVIFLDINMPKLSGIRFVKTLTRPVMIIFTTAYPEYAAEGFEIDAIDFLVKPFSFERFMKAVNKAFERAENRNRRPPSAENVGGATADFILLRSDKKIYKIPYGDIRYFEAYGDYIKVHTAGRKLIIHETFKNLVSLLPAQGFIRIHKSFIVSVPEITLIEGNQVCVAGEMLPIGLVFKEELISRLTGSSSPGR